METTSLSMRVFNSSISSDNDSISFLVFSIFADDCCIFNWARVIWSSRYCISLTSVFSLLWRSLIFFSYFSISSCLSSISSLSPSSCANTKTGDNNNMNIVINKKFLIFIPYDWRYFLIAVVLPNNPSRKPDRMSTKHSINENINGLIKKPGIKPKDNPSENIFNLSGFLLGLLGSTTAIKKYLQS